MGKFDLVELMVDTQCPVVGFSESVGQVEEQCGQAPGDVVERLIAQLVGVRRRRRASRRSICSAASGSWLIQERSAVRVIVAAPTAVIVVTVDVRGPGSRRASSPKTSEGPRTAIRLSD
ncbi:hypothetical protein NCCNTM_40910 [Mycolicibacterium sp. NCC-Tsukiji]|nr:hypothetical protein NCCNTM_40910 [Mycolicibacterium sp. NCC-Tsukiji]